MPERDDYTFLIDQILPRQTTFPFLENRGISLFSLGFFSADIPLQQEKESKRNKKKKVLMFT
ncbi:MAG TPA: hypothetical protein DEP43_03460 [Ruminococcaceae bacterium]|nr:hypothetical protein [Oscillospiraceae bacterium]HCU32804.1 hypothetical protein [Oscillospiraceae bacterium]